MSGFSEPCKDAAWLDSEPVLPDLRAWPLKPKIELRCVWFWLGEPVV